MDIQNKKENDNLIRKKLLLQKHGLQRASENKNRWYNIMSFLLQSYLTLFCASSAPCVYCQTLFSVLCLCPYFTAWAQCAGLIVLGKSFRISRKTQNRMGEEWKLESSVSADDSPALCTTTKTEKKTENEWPRGRVRECDVMFCVMTVWWHVWVVVKWILLNCCKVPDGDLQSGSESGNMPHAHRTILIDCFSLR